MYIAKLEKKMNWQKSANQIIFNSNFVTIIEENFQGSLSFGSLNIILKLVLGESFDVNTI